MNADSAKQLGIGVAEGVGAVVTDMSEATLAPVLDVGKELAKAGADVSSDIAKGKIGDALEDTFSDGGKALYHGLIDTSKDLWTSVRRFFHGW